jgi:hypothetical protein
VVKFFFLGLLLLLTFGAGYVVGDRNDLLVRESREQLKDEMAEKMRALERVVQRTRVRGHLIEMRDALTLAQTHLQHRDFGMARSAVADARTSLDAAIRLDPEETTALRPLEHELDQLGGAITRLGPRAAEQIETLKGKIRLDGDPS